MLTLSAKLWWILLGISTGIFVAGLLVGIKLLMWALRDRMAIVPFRRGDKAYIPIDDIDNHYVSDACRFGQLCVQLVHEGRVEDVVPLSDIGREVFVERAVAQRSLKENET